MLGIEKKIKIKGMKQALNQNNQLHLKSSHNLNTEQEIIPRLTINQRKNKDKILKEK